MKAEWTLLLMLLGVLTPSGVAAHPGHAPGSGYGVAHYVTDPFHAGATLVLVVAAVVVSVWLRRRLRGVSRARARMRGR